MARMMRTFVGIRAGRAVRPALAALSRELETLAPRMRAPHEADLHMSVQFLGLTPDDDVHRVSRALRDAAAELAPIPVVYRGLGAFPEPARARVVFADVVEEPGREGGLAHLAETVGRHLGALGYPPERRRFHAHVTLGRLRGPPPEPLLARIEAAAQHEEVHGAEVLSVLNFILSDPGSGPYHYIDLTTLPLERDLPFESEEHEA